MNKQHYLDLIEPAVKLVARKGEDYNGGPTLHDYFPFRDRSYIQMIHLKALRLVSLADNPKPNFEGTLDTLYDLLNYTTFYLDYLEQQCKTSSADTSTSSTQLSLQALQEARGRAQHYNALAPQFPVTFDRASRS